jgi:predicted ATP-dependent serine protease
MQKSKLSYGQMYYAKSKAKEYGITVDEYLTNKGKRGMTIKKGTKVAKAEEVSLDKVIRLGDLDVNDNMLKCNSTGLIVDTIFSHEGGIPVGTNIMCTGSPGVGKTTVLLHTISNLQKKNPNLKCVFVCAEMGKIQMFKYMKRFPVFGEIDTIFPSDYMNHNFKDVMEKLMSQGYDYVLMDSIVEVLESVKEDNGMSQSAAEKWLIDLCVKNNEGNNKRKAYTTFMLIQQVTKSGVFVGSNKMKHITDAHMEMLRDSDRDGGATYIIFSKNRNGQAGIRFNYQLTNNEIDYGTMTIESDSETSFSLENGVNQ